MRISADDALKHKFFHEIDSNNIYFDNINLK